MKFSIERQKKQFGIYEVRYRCKQTKEERLNEKYIEMKNKMKLQKMFSFAGCIKSKKRIILGKMTITTEVQ